MEENKVPKRETAKLACVKELLTGNYIIQEGWKPNFIKTLTRKLSRINIMGLVVDKPTPYQFLLDDGTGSILVSDFNQQKHVMNLKIGEPVLVIGRPRKSTDSIFIASEIVNSKQVKENPDWLVKRKEELKKLNEFFANSEQRTEDKLVEETDTEEIIQTPEFSQARLQKQLTGDDVVNFIKKKDDGNGCLIEEIISYFGEEADEVIMTLISMGEVYEIKPGMLKVLE